MERRIPFSAKTRALAEQLMRRAADAKQSAESPDRPFSTVDRFRRPLHAMAGTTGTQALLSRALALSKIEFPRLASTKISKEGCVEGVSLIEPPLSSDEANLGELILLGNIVELLSTLLGEAIALRFVQDEWPEASFAYEESGKERNA